MKTIAEWVLTILQSGGVKIVKFRVIVAEYCMGNGWFLIALLTQFFDADATIAV